MVLLGAAQPRPRRAERAAAATLLPRWCSGRNVPMGAGQCAGRTCAPSTAILSEQPSKHPVACVCGSLPASRREPSCPPHAAVRQPRHCAAAAPLQHGTAPLLPAMLIVPVGAACAGCSTLASYLADEEGFAPLGLVRPAPAPADEPTSAPAAAAAPEPARVFTSPDALLDHVTAHWDTRFVWTKSWDVLLSRSRSRGTRPARSALACRSERESLSESESENEAEAEAEPQPQPRQQPPQPAQPAQPAQPLSADNNRPELASFDELDAATQAAFRKRPFFLLVAVQAPTGVRYARFCAALAQTCGAGQQCASAGQQCASTRAAAAARSGRLGASLESFVRADDERMYASAPAMAPRWGVVRTSGPGDGDGEAGPVQILTQTTVWAEDTRAAAAGPSLWALLGGADVTLLNAGGSVPAFRAACAGARLASGHRLRPPWDSYFLSLCTLAAARSNCMKRRVGCVLVRDKRVLATGYNGTPRGVRNCADGGCARCNGSARMGASLSECLCLHAEENALLECGREKGGAQGTVLYCNTYVFPPSPPLLRLSAAPPSASPCASALPARAPTLRSHRTEHPTDTRRYVARLACVQLPVPLVHRQDNSGWRQGGCVRAGVRYGRPLCCTI